MISLALFEGPVLWAPLGAAAAAAAAAGVVLGSLDRRPKRRKQENASRPARETLRLRLAA